MNLRRMKLPRRMFGRVDGQLTRRFVGRGVGTIIVASVAVTSAGCASDSTEPPPTTMPSSPPSVLSEGPVVPGLEPGTNLEPMMDEPARNEETDPDNSQVDPSTDD